MGLDYAPRKPYFSFPLNNIPLYISQHANLDAVKRSVIQKLSMKAVIFNLHIFISVFLFTFNSDFVPASFPLLGLPSYVTCVLLFTSLWVAPDYLVIPDHLLLVFVKLLCVSKDITS